jgi:hypothetical protein
MWAG